MKTVAKISAIAHESPSVDVITLREHRRQASPRRQRRDPLAMTPEDRITEDNDSLRAYSGHRRKGLCVVIGAACGHPLQLKAQLVSRCLFLTRHARVGLTGGVP